MKKFLLAIGLIPLIAVVSSALASAQTPPSSTDPHTAYNEARGLLFSDPSAALVLLDNARAGVDAGVIAEAEWTLWRAYAELQAAEEKWRYTGAFQKALRNYEKSGLPASYEFGRMLVKKAKLQIEKGRAQFAEKTAHQSENILKDTAPSDVDAIAEAMTWRGVSHIFDDKVFRSDIIRSADIFDEARALYTKSPLLSTASHEFKLLIAWQASLPGAIRNNAPEIGDFERLSQVFDLSLRDEEGDRCREFWSVREERIDKRYPLKSGNIYTFQRVGPILGGEGVIIVVDVDSEGHAHNVRVDTLARPPNTKRESKKETRARMKALSELLEHWRMDVNGAPARCIHDQYFVFGFSRDAGFDSIWRWQDSFGVQ